MLMEKKEMQRLVDTFPQRCREAGMKVTPQRMAVYSMLVHTDSHPSAEEVYHSIRKQVPAVSLGTVYKILDMLHEHGFLLKVATQNQTARFDARVDFHHHALCDDCGKLLDISGNLDAALLAQASAVNFVPSACEVLFHGRCQECAEKPALMS